MTTTQYVRQDPSRADLIGYGAAAGVAVVLAATVNFFATDNIPVARGLAGASGATALWTCLLVFYTLIETTDTGKQDPSRAAQLFRRATDVGVSKFGPFITSFTTAFAMAAAVLASIWPPADVSGLWWLLSLTAAWVGLFWLALNPKPKPS